MKKQLFILLQTLLPQHLTSWLAGRAANCKIKWFKNTLIRSFASWYNISLEEAVVKNLCEFNSFNDFFTRKLAMQYRPMPAESSNICSPADSIVSQFGQIQQHDLIQAKGHRYSLEALLATENVSQFNNGHFLTGYLAPAYYHRVHMPLDGQLKRMVFIPGKLYSVNQTTAEAIPGLYSLNERLVCYFETPVGEMALILIGALIVGSIQPAWQNKPMKYRDITEINPDKPIHLKRGEEVGQFQLGSSVILLFPQQTITWNSNIRHESMVYVRQAIGKINKLSKN